MSSSVTGHPVVRYPGAIFVSAARDGWSEEESVKRVLLVPNYFVARRETRDYSSFAGSAGPCLRTPVRPDPQILSKY